MLNNKSNFLPDSNSLNNHLLKIKVDKNLNENKFSITVNNLESREKRRKKI